MAWTVEKVGSSVDNRTDVGTQSWGNATNALIWSTGNYATMGTMSNFDHFKVRDLRLMVGGVIGGTDYATDQELGPGTTVVNYGGDGYMWGYSTSQLTPQSVMRSDFGIALSCVVRNPTDTTDLLVSNYLVISGFNFEVPDTAVITGVTVNVIGDHENIGGGTSRTALYFATVRIHYTWGFGATGYADSYGYIKFDEQDEPLINQDKDYQYMSYEAGQFRGELQDVVSQPEVLSEVNSLPGDFEIVLARDIRSKKTAYDTWQLSGNEDLVSETYDSYALGVETDFSIGPGTDIEVNHDIEVKEYYGGYENLVLNTGEAILLHDLDTLGVPNGYPNGRMMFKGYVSRYSMIFGQGDTSTKVTLMSYFDELNQDVYQTADTSVLNNISTDVNQTDGYGIRSYYPYECDNVGQTFTAPSNMSLARIGLMIRRNGIDNDPASQHPEITVELRTGSTVGAGTLLGTSVVKISNTTYKEVSFPFDGVSLTNASSYNFVVRSSLYKMTSSQNYPAFMAVGASYSGGQGYAYVNTSFGSGSYIDASMDFGFRVWSLGGQSTVTQNSKDPSNILKDVLDYAALRGSVVRYSPTSIEISGSTVSAKFNTNTLKEALDYILKLSPSDWFYLLDPGQVIAELHSRPSVVTQWFTLEGDIVEMDLGKSIESMVNEVWFSGGGSPNLLKRYYNSDSQKNYRRMLSKQSDNRVTDTTTSGILSNSIINRYKNPIYAGTVKILRDEHPNMIYAGELAGFRNFGNFIDLLTVQVLSVKTTPYYYELQIGLLLPQVDKRVEDIKRNLDLLDMEDNPTAPS